jgi:uncharacterized OsmC-like protein
MASQTKAVVGDLNGVDVERLRNTGEAMRSVPALAKFTFRVSNRWLKGGLNRTTINGFRGAGGENHRDGFVIDNAEPSLIAGHDEAPNPVEYLLHALVGCLTTTFVYHAAMQGVRVRAIESQVEGQVDLRSFLGVREDVPGGFEAVSVRFRVSADCPDDELASLMDAARRRSPVANFVVRAVPTSVVCEAL